MDKFTWVPFYEELSEKLLFYKADRQRLIEQLREAHRKVNKNFPKIESDNDNIPDIDPFTVFALFNRGAQSIEARKSLCKGYKEVFKVDAAIPNDFEGIPVFNYTQYCFYRYVSDPKRDDTCFDVLWNLFEQAILYTKNQGNIESFNKYFEESLNLPLVKLSKLTIGLFQIKPFYFLNLDTRNKDFIVTKMALSSNVSNGIEYLNICNEVKKNLDRLFGCVSFYELSLASFYYSQNKKGSKEIEEKQNIAETDSLGTKTEKEKQEQVPYKNVILYGPPGTGKTFNTVTYAVAIIENKDYNDIKFEAEKDYTQVKKRYEDYRSQGLIDFVTFHQSYGYEEFIEGIKPKTENGQITYDIKPGIFNEFCDRARINITQENYSVYGFNSSPTIWKVSLEGTGDNNTRRDCLQNGYIRIGFDSYGKIITDETIFKEGGKNVLNAFVNDMRIGDIIFSCFTNTTIDAIGVVTGDYEWQDRFEHYKRVRRVKWIYKGKKEIIDINGGKVMTLPTVYRLNISLDDVIKIVKSQDNEVRDFDFNLANAKKKNYVFIIDEINRGNISKIFGELITLIEDTKREGKDEAMSVKLPYSRKDFTIPDNVYIIGTMNTSDRSITTIDTALRRRFHFIEMMPDYSQLAGVVVEGIEISKMLKTMNNRIEALYDREHMIGHAYFRALKKNENINTLSEIFENKVIPLLQEYFYDDYEKIRLILGDNQKSDNTLQFFNKAEINNLQLFGDNADELIADSHYTYSINKDAFKMPQAYRFVYEKAGMSEKQEI